MPRLGKVLAALLALIPLALLFAASPARAEKRIALVIGNAGYQAGALNTPANDAGLIAQTLEAAGFDVAGARDLDQDSLRRAFRDFLEKATSSEPDTLAFIYVSGYGLQLEGENYFVPVDAKIARDSDVAAEALRISDYTRPLAALKLKAAVVVVDAARANPFAKSGPPLAGGLALVEPEPGMLIAFNAAPGTAGPEGAGPYGAYAQALVEMLREGGLPLAAAFDRARLRVNDITKGAEVPWQASKIESALVLFERTPDAPAPAVSVERAAAFRSRPIRELGAQEAYAAALDRDTLEGYSDFLAAYPGDPMAARVRAMVAARREALTWRRTRAVDTPPAYWSYLRRYSQGPHAADAHRRLAFLAAALEPPPSFDVLAYDLPPPPPDEIVYIRRPVLIFDDPVFAFGPPPPPPVIFLASPPPEFVVLPPPPRPVGIFVLPMPVYRPVPVWVRPPAYVAPPPPNNVIYRNVHNTVVVNNVTNTVTITNPSGQMRTVAPTAQPSAQPATAPGGVPAAPTRVLLGPALPPSVARKAATLQSQAPQGPGVPSTAVPPAAKALPGMRGRPLPPAAGTAVAPAAPSAAIPPAAPSAPGPAGGAKPGAPPAQAPAAKRIAPSAPSAPATAATPRPAPGNGAKFAPPSPAPAATATTPPTPPAAATPGMPTPPRGDRAKRDRPPTQVPAVKLAPPAPNAAKPGTPSAAAPSAATVPAVKPAMPPRPSAVKPVMSPPPAAKLAPPPPPPPSAKPVAPPHAPAAAAARPAPTPGAQARATAAQGMPAGQKHGGRKRSARLQVSFAGNVR